MTADEKDRLAQTIDEVSSIPEVGVSVEFSCAEKSFWVAGWKDILSPLVGRDVIQKVEERAVEVSSCPCADGPVTRNQLRLWGIRAMGIDALVEETKVFDDKRTASGKRSMVVSKWKQVRDELSDREREVLEGSARRAPVCFHANRNAFAQACKEAELTEEQIRDVLDHADVRETRGYMRRIGRQAKQLPNVHGSLADQLARARAKRHSRTCIPRWARWRQTIVPKAGTLIPLT